jgi:uncharacterized RmlC-like cupin family protein
MKLLSVLLAAGAAAFAQQSTVNIDNDLVKVLTVVQPSGAKSKLHEHSMNRVMIYRNAGGQTLRFIGGRVEEQKWKSGDVFWSPAGGKHTSENLTGVANTLVEIELKKAAPSAPAKTMALDPVKLAPKEYKIVLENPQTRILRVKIGPRQSVPMHEHGLPRVVVYLTDQDFKVTSEDGKVEFSKRKAGDVVFGGKARHKEENLSSQPFEVLVVEIK